MVKALSDQAQPKAKMLTQMVQTILEVSRPVKIVLFGSWVKGSATPNSDYDLLIIEAEPFGKGRSRRRLIGKLGRALATFNVHIGNTSKPCWNFHSPYKRPYTRYGVA